MKRFRTPEIVLGIGIGIIFSLFVAGVGSYQTSHCEQSQQHQTAAPNPNDPHATGQQGGGGDHKKPEYGKHPPFFACGATGLLKSAVGFMDGHEGFFVGGFTMSLFIATILLWRSTEKLWAEARDTSERQATDTRILQRAYLSVEPGGISASSSADKCHPNIDIRNAGNLPATAIRWLIESATSQNHRRQTFHIDLDKLEGKNTLPPGALMRQGGPIIYIGADQGDLRNEIGLYLYIWGAVYYDDGFGIERVTKFCHRYNSVNLLPVKSLEVETLGTITGYEVFSGAARYHRYGNDAT